MREGVPLGAGPVPSLGPGRGNLVAPGLCVVDAGACGFVVVVEVPFLGIRALFKSM